MSVIIRLQNLPWSANAADIREFFKGLLIPEGGVHIVGGEQGDAFIAFGSDEDARLAMRKSNGILKGIQISLLLSSRSEMQKVIEMARQQAMAQQQSFAAPVVPAAPSVPTPIQNSNSAAPQPSAAAAPTPYSAMQQQQQQQQPMSQYGSMSAYYSATMYNKPTPEMPKTPETGAPAAAAAAAPVSAPLNAPLNAPLSAPFGYSSSPDLMGQRWHNGFGKVDPSRISGTDSEAYNLQTMGNKPQFNSPYPFSSNDSKMPPYGMQPQQPPVVPVSEEYDERELYQQALRASKKLDASRFEDAPTSSASSIASNPPYSVSSVTSTADRARYSSSVSQPGLKVSSSSNNQSPRRSEHSVEKKDASKEKDKLREKDKYGRDERDRDSRRRRSKSRSRSRDRDRRRRHRSRSRSRDRTSRRRRSRSKERQDRSRDRDKSRSSTTTRDRNERRSLDDKPSAENVPAPPVVLSKNSGATLPGLGEIPQELPKSLPNAILGMPPSQEIITSDMYAPSHSGGAWGMNPKLKNTQSATQQPPLVETTQSNIRDPRMQTSGSSTPVILPSEPRTDRWGIPIQEPLREPNQRKSNAGNDSPVGLPSGQNRLAADPSHGRDFNRFSRQPDNWDNPERSERPERDVHPDQLSGLRNDMPPERPRAYLDSVRDPRASQHVTRSPDVGMRPEPPMADRPNGPSQSRWSSPVREPQNNYGRDPRAARIGEPGYQDLPPRRMEAPRPGDDMEGHRLSVERYPDSRPIPGRPRDDRMWEPEMPERYPPIRDDFPPTPDMDDPGVDGPGVHNAPFDSSGRGIRGRGGFDPRGRGGRRRGFGRLEGDTFFPEDAEPERFRASSFPSEYPPFDEGHRGSPSGPGPFRGRGGAPRGRGGYARTASPIGDRPPTCSVELLNLPPSANYRAIRESFYGVYVPRDSIKLLGDENGVKIGVGLIRFNSEADAVEASRRDGMFLHDHKIQIRLIDEEIYDKHEDFRVLRPRPSFETAPVNFIRSEWVHIMGMPPGKTEDDVATIFSSSYINDILREVYPNTVKATGGFFMRLSCPDEAHVLINESRGIDVDGSLLHLRQATHAEIEECTVKLADRHLIEDSDAGPPDGRPPMPEEFDKRRDGPQRSNPGPGRHLNNAGPHPAVGNPGRKTVLLATPPMQPDLRESLTHGNGDGKRPLENPNEAPSRKRPAPDEDLLTDSVVVHDVKMGTTHNNVVDFFSDEGLVPEHVHFVPYDPKVGGRVFVIFPRVSHARKALKKSGQMLGPSVVRIELIAKPEVMSAMGLPFNPLELIKKSDPTDGDRPEGVSRAGRGPLLETPAPGPARAAPGPRGSPLATNNSGGAGPKQGEIIPEQFGQPGCVVALSNIPFNATTEDILMFLSREFPRVAPEHVIRRYNEHNQPTSDARVSFQTPEDAERCVRALNRKLIFNRVIAISLVEN